MIDKAYWGKIAEEWKKETDGIGTLPPIDTGGADKIEPDPDPTGSISGDEIDDILADLGLDDI